MAPAALTFQWGLAPLGRLGWAVGFIYLAAAAVRLARFNIQRVADKRYFVGMPSPSAAGIPAATIFFASAPITDRGPAFLALAILLVPALLMVSTFRYRSLKTLDLSSPRSYKVIVPVAAWVALMTAYTEEVLVAMAYLYLVSPIIEWAIGRITRRPPAPPPAPVAAIEPPPGACSPLERARRRHCGQPHRHRRALARACWSRRSCRRSVRRCGGRW